MKNLFLFFRFLCLTSAFLLLTFLSSICQPRFHAASFYSPSVRDTMRVRILLPADYIHSRTYPVLFLLHGYGGDETDWTLRTNIENYTASIPLIVVMPEAKNSWYVNSETDTNARFEDYIINDLPKYVDSLYPIDTTREAIAGLSMGGYGALVLALRHLSKFLFAGDLSGALTIPEIIDSVNAHPTDVVPGGQGPLMPSIFAAFGKNDKQFRDNHDLTVLLQNKRADNLPYIFCAVGIQDGYRDFLHAHHIFTNMLRENGKLYEYHEIPGEHNWKFWDEETQPLLARMAIVMKLLSK